MSGAHAFLTALAIVLCVAAVTTVVFQRLRQPVVMGYILAGLIVGPYTSIPVFADRETVQTLSELGVILLMFSLGLEFSLRKVAEVGLAAGLTAVIESSLMFWLGFATSQAFGWTLRESIFGGAMIAISSTTIVTRAFHEQSITGRRRDLVFGILIAEDLIAILLLTTLTAFSSHAEVSALVIAKSGGRLLAFLVVLISLGMVVVPRAVRAIDRLARPETTLVASIGFCFALSLLALELGYSVALGAFIAGSLIAESGEGERVRELIVPVRDLFVAIFFVSVGMLINPGLIVQHWPAVLAFALAVTAGKFIGVSTGAFLTGNGTRTSIQAGMSLAQIGEFSFIMAALGVTLHAARETVYAVAVAVSAITTLTTPWLIRYSDPVARFVDRKLPRPLQIFAALYGSWLERLGTVQNQGSTSATIRRLVKLLLVDAAGLGLLTLGTAFLMSSITQFTSKKLGISPPVTRVLIVFGAGALGVPFLIGIARITRGLGVAMAQAALPALPDSGLDLAAAPRRAFVVTVQLGVLMLLAVPFLALTQALLPRGAAVALLGVLFAVLGIVFWQSARNLHGHVKAGAEVILEALVAQARKPGTDDTDDDFERIKHLMPGLGEPVPLRLDERCRAVGKTLAELNLRGMTGASVLAIARGDEGVIVPTAREVLRAGDVLALAGTREAIAAATELLDGEPKSSPEEGWT